MWETADLVKFAQEILNGKYHFLCSATSSDKSILTNILTLTESRKSNESQTYNVNEHIKSPVVFAKENNFCSLEIYLLEVLVSFSDLIESRTARIAMTRSFKDDKDWIIFSGNYPYCANLFGCFLYPKNR